jgi:hypothetical protein
MDGFTPDPTHLDKQKLICSLFYNLIGFPPCAQTGFIVNGQLLSCNPLITKGDFVGRDWHLLHSPGGLKEVVVRYEGLVGFHGEQDKSASAGEAHERIHHSSAEVVAPHSSGSVVVSVTQEEEEEGRCVRVFDTDEYNEVVALVHSVVEGMEGVH